MRNLILEFLEQIQLLILSESHLRLTIESARDISGVLRLFPRSLCFDWSFLLLLRVSKRNLAFDERVRGTLFCSCRSILFKVCASLHLVSLLHSVVIIISLIGPIRYIVNWGYPALGITPPKSADRGFRILKLGGGLPRRY